MVAAIVILSIIAYLFVGVILSRTIFRYVWENVLHAYYDTETAVATGLAWPFMVIVGVGLVIGAGLGWLFGGRD